jgi:hypothetical protein
MWCPYQSVCNGTISVGMYTVSPKIMLDSSLSIECYEIVYSSLVSLRNSVNDLESNAFVCDLVVTIGPELANNFTLGILTVVVRSFD